MALLWTPRATARGLWVSAIGLGAAAFVQAGCQALRHSDTDARPPFLVASSSTAASPAAIPCGAEGGRPTNQETLSVVESTVPPVDSTKPGRPAPSSPGPSPAASVIDLGAALRLAGVDNPTIDRAEERVQEALADQLGARALLLPSLDVGGNYRRHTGALQQSQGDIITPTSQDLYLGAGAGAVGSGTVGYPGVWLFAHLGDALYAPLAARQRVVARESEAISVRNSVLLDVASAYLILAEAEARLELLRRSESEAAEIARITTEYARTGQGTEADANRTRANTELVRSQVREAEGAVASASARLARLVSIDPAVQLRTPGGPVAVFRLVPEDSDPEALVAEAVRSRPELRAREANLQEAQTLLRQERLRPWLPLLSVGCSNGWFGGGSSLVTDDFAPLTGRSDFDVMAVWNIQNLGFGNVARVRQARAVVGQGVAGYGLALNQVRREVLEAQAAAKTAGRQYELARQALRSADEGFRLEADRIRLGQGRPIAVVDSFNQLLDTRQELLRALVAFDVAQFQLFVALGNTPGAGL